MSVKVAIVVDIMGDNEEEIAEMMDELRARIEIDAELLVWGAAVDIIDDPRVDLVIIDYGGMLPGCDDLVRGNFRYVAEWAENHPSKLVMIWTSFSVIIYQDEVGGEFDHLDNIILWGASRWTSRDKVEQKIRAWYQ